MKTTDRRRDDGLYLNSNLFSIRICKILIENLRPTNALSSITTFPLHFTPPSGPSAYSLAHQTSSSSSSTVHRNSTSSSFSSAASYNDGGVLAAAAAAAAVTPESMTPRPRFNAAATGTAAAGSSSSSSGGRDAEMRRSSRDDRTAHYGTKPGYIGTSKIHFPTSEGVSEMSKRANE